MVDKSPAEQASLYDCALCGDQGILVSWPGHSRGWIACQYPVPILLSVSRWPERVPHPTEQILWWPPSAGCDVNRQCHAYQIRDRSAGRTNWFQRFVDFPWVFYFVNLWNWTQVTGKQNRRFRGLFDRFSVLYSFAFLFYSIYSAFVYYLVLVAMPSFLPSFFALQVSNLWHVRSSEEALGSHWPQWHFCVCSFLFVFLSFLCKHQHTSYSVLHHSSSRDWILLHHLWIIVAI